MFPELDPNDKFDYALLDLIKKGLMEAAYNEATGELTFALTDLGKEVCNDLYGPLSDGTDP